MLRENKALLNNKIDFDLLKETTDSASAQTLRLI
jgi:hypothetical protein